MSQPPASPEKPETVTSESNWVVRWARTALYPVKPSSLPLPGSHLEVASVQAPGQDDQCQYLTYPEIKEILRSSDFSRIQGATVESTKQLMGLLDRFARDVEARRLRIESGLQPRQGSAAVIAAASRPAFRRHLFWIHADSWKGIPSNLNLPSRRFTCLLVWDSNGIPQMEVETLMTNFISTGCVAIDIWGSGCSKAHEMFDWVSIESSSDSPVLMSTSHEGKSLADAIWYFLRCSNPTDELKEECDCSVAVVIGSEAWARVVSSALVDPEGFLDSYINQIQRPVAPVR